jgi:hypothetical protein
MESAYLSDYCCYDDHKGETQEAYYLIIVIRQPLDILQA